MPKLKDNKRRFFVDPATCGTSCAGWALFEGSRYVGSGTIHVPHKEPISKKAVAHYLMWRGLASLGADEAHVESLVKKTHEFTHGSVWAVRLAFTEAGAQFYYKTLPIRSWQKFADWNGEAEPLKRWADKPEDERAAIGMGLYFVNEGWERDKKVYDEES